MNDRRIWLDGVLVPWEDATVHVLSHSHQRGSLVFDYLSVHDTAKGPALFCLREHLERFVRSCELVGLPLRENLETLSDATRETVRANPGCHSVKISAYLPSIEVDVVPQDDHVSVAIAAYDNVEDVIRRNRGRFHAAATLKLRIEREKRNRRPDIMPPQAKVSANYVSPMVAKWRARRDGFDEIVLLSEDGTIAEAPTSNLFLKGTDRVLRTPREERVLHGVTRSCVMALAADEGIACQEADLTPDDLYAATEIFLTATTANVWPVLQVDDRVVGEGDIGDVTRRLGERLERVQRGEDAKFERWLDYVAD